MLRAGDAEAEGRREPADLAGETAVAKDKAHITVSNAHGHLCHIRAVSHYKSTPRTCASWEWTRARHSRSLRPLAERQAAAQGLRRVHQPR